jgi:hypothetical protein
MEQASSSGKEPPTSETQRAAVAREATQALGSSQLSVQLIGSSDAVNFWVKIREKGIHIVYGKTTACRVKKSLTRRAENVVQSTAAVRKRIAKSAVLTIVQIVGLMISAISPGAN